MSIRRSGVAAIRKNRTRESSALLLMAGSPGSQIAFLVAGYQEPLFAQAYLVYAAART
jgi:hypothetical protein